MGPPTSNETATPFPGALPWIIGSHLLCALGFSVFSLLPKYLMAAHGYDQAEVGPVAMGIPLGSALCSPLAVMAMKRVPLSSLVRGGALLFASCALLFPRAAEHGAAVGLTFVAGAAAMAIFNGSSAMVAELAPAHATARFIGLHGAAGMLGYGAGPLLLESLSARWGWPCAFAVAAGLNLIGASLRLPPFEVARDAAPGSFGLGRLWPVLAVSLFAGVMHNSLWCWHQPLVLLRGASEVHPYFTGMSAGALLMRVVFGGLPDRVGPYRAALASGTLYVLVTLSMTWVTPHSLSLVGFGHGIAHGVFYPALFAYAVKGSGAQARRGILASLYAAFTVGGTLANLVFSQWGQLYGPASVFPLSALLGSIAVFVLFGVRVRSAGPTAEHAQAEGSRAGHESL